MRATEGCARASLRRAGGPGASGWERTTRAVRTSRRSAGVARRDRSGAAPTGAARAPRSPSGGPSARTGAQRCGPAAAGGGESSAAAAGVAPRGPGSRTGDWRLVGGDSMHAGSALPERAAPSGAVGAARGPCLGQRSEVRPGTERGRRRLSSPGSRPAVVRRGCAEAGCCQAGAQSTRRGDRKRARRCAGTANSPRAARLPSADGRRPQRTPVRQSRGSEQGARNATQTVGPPGPAIGPAQLGDRTCAPRSHRHAEIGDAGWVGKQSRRASAGEGGARRRREGARSQPPPRARELAGPTPPTLGPLLGAACAPWKG